MPPNSPLKVMSILSSNPSKNPLPLIPPKVFPPLSSLLVVDISQWIPKVSCSGCIKVVPERIYSMAIHPQTNPLLVYFPFFSLIDQIAVGDKGGKIGFWSLPASFDQSTLPVLEDGKRDISSLGTSWEFQISNE